MNTKGLEKGRRRDGMLASKVKAIVDGTESFPAICRGCSTASVSNLLENRGGTRARNISKTSSEGDEKLRH